LTKHPFALKTRLGYLSAQPDGRLEANRPKIGSYETFTAVKGHLPHTICIRTTHGKNFTFTPALAAMCNAGGMGDHEFVTPIKVGKGQIALRFHSGKYLCAESQTRILADRAKVGEYETFIVEKIKSEDSLMPRKVHIKSVAHNKFLSAQQDGRMLADRAEAKTWETFELIKKDNGKYNIKSFHGKFLSAQQDGKLLADRAEAKSWEEFEIIKKGKNYNIKTTAHKKFLSAQQDGSLMADRSEAKSWEEFEIKKA